MAAEPIFVVADGMGGGPGGSLASEIAVGEFSRFAGGPLPAQRDVLSAVVNAHGAVSRAAGPAGVGMGTTLVGLALVNDGESLYWLGFHVGDSRLYRYAAGVLEQLSRDHSEVQELIAAGDLRVADRRAHHARHVITRAIGVNSVPAEPDCLLLCPTPGERFLLCSDGLTEELTDERIAALLAAQPVPQAAARRLVVEAVEAGGRDNVSAVVVDVLREEGDGPAPVVAPRPAGEGAR